MLRSKAGRRSLWACALLWLALPCHAQVESQGHGELSLTFGQGSAPVGEIATDVVTQQRAASHSRLSQLAYRIVGGYQFADYVSAEAGLTHLGPLRSRASYAGTTHEVTAEAVFEAIEAVVVGHLPFAGSGRVDLSLGLVAGGLATQLTTAYGLPAGQRNRINAHQLGLTTGADVEWRLGESIALIVGYHLYPDVGSKRLIGSSNGTLSVIAGGIHVEF